MTDQKRQGRTYIADNIKKESVVIDAKGHEMSKQEFEEKLRQGTYSQHEDAKK